MLTVQVMETREDEVFCPHCGVEVAKKTFKTHKRLYYDSNTDQWVKRRTTEEVSEASEYAYPILVCWILVKTV